MLSLFWCQPGEWWENLIKVQTGFTSFLNPFRGHFWIFLLQPFLRILKHVTNVDQKKKSLLLQITVTFQSQSLDGFWTSQNHMLHGNQHNETFVLYCATWQFALTPLLKHLWDGMWSQYDTGSQNCCSDCQICRGARGSSPGLWAGRAACSSLNSPVWTDTRWGIQVVGELIRTGHVFFLSPRDCVLVPAMALISLGESP